MTQGKLKRLNAVADKNGVISAAAMDQRGSLQKSIAKEKGIFFATDAVQAVGRDDERCTKRLEAPHERPVTRQALREPRNRVLEIAVVVGWRNRVVQGLLLLVEREPLTEEHADARQRRTHLASQIVEPEPREILLGLGGGWIEAPDLAACLTLSKNDFIRTGTRGASF
jgi:hypothetical protein